MAAKLTDYKVLTFDCYGTLIDWETGIWDALQPAIVAAGAFDLSREAALALFGKHEAQHQHAHPTEAYDRILSRVHASIASEIGAPASAARDRDFGASVAHWPAFADSARALRALKRHFRLVILSNVHRAGFAASNQKLGVEFDAVYTAQDIGSYKPSPKNFEYMLAHLASDFGLAPADVLHTAQSLRHDHRQAKAFGLANAWIDRQGLSRGGSWGATAAVESRPETDFVFYSMAEMADAVAAET